VTELPVLVAALPRRHLPSAVETERASGRVVLPAGSPGDLARTEAGTRVLLILAGPDELPAATWTATFVRQVLPEPGAVPDLAPPTWVAEHGSRAIDPAPPSEGEDDDDDAAGPQSYFEVVHLVELPREDWVFANELVRKQERGGRAFLPRAPRLVRLRD
jgi:hypothetical protein